MRKDETDDAVRLAATVALYNALEFAQTNFENADERNYLMQVICEGTIATNEKVREASFECLVKIAAHHYAKLPAYMQVSAYHSQSADSTLTTAAVWTRMHSAGFMACRISSS